MSGLSVGMGSWIRQWHCIAAVLLQSCVAPVEPASAQPGQAASVPAASLPNQSDRVLTAVEKARLIQQLLTEHGLNLYTTRDGREALCLQMFEALRSEHGLTYLEPTFRTEDPEDPRFAKYNECKDFNWEVAAQLQFNGIAALGVKHFALYQLEEGSNEGPRPFELVYAEVSPVDLHGHMFGGYREIDLQACAFKSGVSIDQSADLATVRSNFPTAVNTLLRHEGRYFVVELVDYMVRRKPDDLPLYNMQLFERTPTGDFQGVCGWSEPVPDSLK